MEVKYVRLVVCRIHGQNFFFGEWSYVCCGDHRIEVNAIDSGPMQGHLVFQLNSDERQRPYRLCSQQPTSRCHVGVAGPPQESNRGIP